MAAFIGRLLALVFVLTAFAAIATCGSLLAGCTQPLIPVEDQWKIEEWGTPLPFPSPALDWQGGWGGGPAHE